MLKIKAIHLFFCLVLGLDAASASFLAPALRVKMPEFDTLLSVQRNQSSVIIYDSDPVYFYRNYSRLYEFVQYNDGFEFNELPQTNPLNDIFPNGMVFDKTSDSLFVFGVISDIDSLSNTSLLNPAYLTVYRYVYSTQQWSPALPPSGYITHSAVWPLERSHYAVAYDMENNRAYLSGGVNSHSEPYNDFWQIDFRNGDISFTQLANLTSTRVSHQMALLSDGRILFVGGSRQFETQFVALSRIDVYDTRESRWVNVGPAIRNVPELPKYILSHSLAADSSRNRVIVSNGETLLNNSTDPTDGIVYMPMVILDLATWSWDFADTGGIPPERRSNALTSILNHDNLILAFGQDAVDNFNDINVLALDTMQWISRFDDEAAVLSGAHAKIIIIAVSSAVLGITVLCIVYFCWKERESVRGYLWNQREGEPLWTEISRLSVMGATLACFVILLVFVVKQVLESPTVIQSYTLPVTDVTIPDIRICIDRIVQDDHVFPLACTFASGQACYAVLYQLNMSLFRPPPFHPYSKCYLIRTPEDYRLSTDTQNLQGSKVEISFAINEMDANLTPPTPNVYISLYPREKDPNVLVYNLPGADEIVLSDEEYDDWVVSEQHGEGSDNIYEVQFSTINNIQYVNGYMDSLDSTAWNLFGIFSKRTRGPLLETAYSYLPPDTNSLSDTPAGLFLATLRILPRQFEIIVKTEVKVYTFLGAFGTVGGIAGILFSIQVLLFGQRPQSPWGFVQRFSFGRMRRSLLQSLWSNFQTSDVPLVDPCDARNLKESEVHSSTHRASKIEQRLWLLERMLAAYHLNDDVFKGLNEAVLDGSCNQAERSSQLSNNSTVGLKDLTVEKPKLAGP